MAGQSDGKRAGTGADPAARVAWVDAAKGVGILLVVAGHVWWRPGPAHHVIYAFHMPLFFILSGHMVKPQPGWPLLARQARSLLVPFVAFSLILIATDLALERARGHAPIFAGFGAGLWAILFRTESLRGPFTILWFVPCLFLARLAWNAVAVRMPDAANWRWALLVALIMAVAHGVAARTGVSPLGMIAVPAAFTCYWIGQLWKARPPGLPLLLPLLGLLGVATLVALPAVNLKPGDFGVPFFSLAGAAAISILLGMGLARAPESLAGPLAWLGRASLVIMYVHVAFIHYLTPYLDRWMLFAVALAGSICLHLLAAATRVGRIVLLGERS